jgi:hypothetical protein
MNLDFDRLLISFVVGALLILIAYVGTSPKRNGLA